MTNKLTDDQIAAARAALDEALAQGPWNASSFLGLIGKKLEKIREDFEDALGLDRSEAVVKASNLVNQNLKKRSEMTKIFVSLYATDGSNLHSWERIIANLPKQVVSRPIYAEEDDIVTAIRNKLHPINEGYVTMFVNPKDILAQDAEKVSFDKLGKPLLALKDEAIELDNIDSFIHQGIVYDYKLGRLVKR